MFDGFFSSALGAVGGMIGSGMQAHTSKRLMKYQYQLNQQSLKDSPSNYKAGLLAAGYNPMLAINGGMSAPATGIASSPTPDFTSLGDTIQSAFSAKKARDLVEEQIKNEEKKGDAIDASVMKDKAEADLFNEQANKVKLEVASIDPEAKKENERYGKGHFVPDLLSGARFLRDNFWEPYVSPIFSPRPTSAKQVKSISDEDHKKEKVLGDRVRRRRMHH